MSADLKNGDATINNIIVKMWVLVWRDFISFIPSHLNVWTRKLNADFFVMSNFEIEKEDEIDGWKFLKFI